MLVDRSWPCIIGRQRVIKSAMVFLEKLPKISDAGIGVLSRIVSIDSHSLRSRRHQLH